MGARSRHELGELRTRYRDSRNRGHDRPDADSVDCGRAATDSADVVDAQGRFLAHASEQRVDAEFDSYYFWGSNYGDVNERTFAAGTQRVTERLADWFVGGKDPRR